MEFPEIIDILYPIQLRTGLFFISHAFFTQQESYLHQYWGQHLWARGYFYATVGKVDEENDKKLYNESV
ncbi:transposase [Virgibacillus proomii]|nr:transposase [Virgibacillus proomii]